MYIKYCVFSKILRYIPDSGLSLFPLGVSECTQWQVKHQRCSRTGRVQKNQNILRKNTIFKEHPVRNFPNNNWQFSDPCITTGEAPGSYPPFDEGSQLDVWVKNSSGQPLGSHWVMIKAVTKSLPEWWCR